MSADGLHFQRSLRPVKATVELNIIPLSTASLQMPDGDSLPARAYVEMFTALGSAGYFRVRSPQASYGDETPFAELEHAAVEIGDYLVTGKIQDTMTASAALQTVFGHYRGNLWQIASTSINDIVVVDIDHETVLSGLLAIMDQLPDYHMDFDFSTRPWTLRVVGNDSGVTAEGRLGRNVKSARITYDDSELCTRAYYEIEDEDGDGMPFSRWYTYDSSTIRTYGVVERVVQVDISSDEDKALRVVKDYLRKHQEPIISVEIDGQELSQITGESLDRFQIGKMFRLALPDYHVTVDRNITELIFDDVYGKPLQITVHLASELDTVVSFLHDVAAGTGSSVGSGGGTKKQSDKWKEYYTGLQQTDYFWDMYARKVNKNGEILKQAGLYIDAGGVLQYADDNENMLYARLKVTASYIRAELTDAKNSLYSRIEQTASYIRSEVSDTANGLQSRIEQTASHLRSEFEDTANGLYSRIEQTASYLRAEYQDTAASLRSEIELTASHLRTDFEDTANGLRSSIEQTASRVSIVVDGNGNVKPASIVASINNATKESSVLISADRISLSGNTTVEDSMTIENGALLVKKAAVFGTTAGRQVSINNGSVNAPTLQVNSGGKLVIVGSATGEHYDITSSVIQGIIKSASVSGNVLTLTPFYGSPITFSKATSLSGEWSGDSYVVTAKQNSATVATHTFNPPMRLNGTTAASNFSAEIYETPSGGTPVARKSVYGYLISGGSGSGSYVDVNTQYDGSGSSVARISVGSVYTDGVSSVKVIFDTSNKTVVPSTSSSAVDSIAISLNTGSLSGSGTARKRTVKALAGSYTAQSAEITDYGDGYGAGRDAVIINKGSWSGGQVQFSKNIGSGTSKGVRVGLTGSWSGTNYNYTIRDYYDSTSGVSTGYTGTINAYSVYEDGMYDAYGNMTFTEQPSNKQIVVKLKGTQLDTISTSATWWAGYSAGQSGSASWQDGYDAGYAAAYGVGATEIDGAYTDMIDKRAGQSAIAGMKNFGGLQCPTADSWAIVNIMVRNTTVRGYISLTAASQASYQQGYDAGYAAGYNVTTGQISVGNVQSIGTNSGGRSSAGSISKSKLVARSYLGFSVNVHGTQKLYYITVND